MKFDKKDLLLYAITDRSWLGGETLYAQTEKALRGGATFLQLREKELDRDSFRKEAMELKTLCRKYRVPFLIDDDVALALETEADGVHVGQSDAEAGEVRKLLGEGKILGVSAQTVEQARRGRSAKRLDAQCSARADITETMQTTCCIAAEHTNGSAANGWRIPIRTEPAARFRARLPHILQKARSCAAPCFKPRNILRER